MKGEILREGFTIVCGIAVEHRDPMRDEYIISGLQLEKLKKIEALIAETVQIRRAIEHIRDEK